jgi:hypothetical protein
MIKLRLEEIFRYIYAVVIIILTTVCAIVVFSFLNHEENPKLGVSFSTYYSQYLGFDPLEVYDAVLNEMDIDVIRIPVYWSQIESADNQYDFSSLDYIMQRAQEENIEVTLAIGAKVPRWPECFVPSWITDTGSDEYKSQLFSMLETVVNRYKDNTALSRWQVENEPFFPFGECATPNPNLFKQELDLVRKLDAFHEIQSTASGEHALWFLRTRNIDILGVSLYREVWNDQVGAMAFPYQPIIYILQSALADILTDKVVISELQMEPWLHEDIHSTQMSITELSNLFSAEDAMDNYYFAKKIGASEIYFWGVEWWYFLKINGFDGLWQQGIEIINNR